MIKNLALLSLSLSLSILSFAQDMNAVRAHLDTLCSPYMGGRGYIDKGEKRAGKYISDVFKSLELEAFEGTKKYQQRFDIAVNTFPGEPVFAEDLCGKKTRGHLGYHFLPAPHSGHRNYKKDTLPIRFIVQQSLIHSMAQRQDQRAIVIVTDSSYLDKGPNDFGFTKRPKLDSAYTTRNVIGYVPGTEQPDSFIVFCGHFDHLGKIGPEVYFPGANDNASGTAMVLELAKHYTANPQPYSIAFMAFGAEEVGLLGSKHYVNNPLFPLEQIKMVINLDILGGGDDGIQVVNGKKHRAQFDQMVSINASNSYLPQVKIRGESFNSDHAPFDAKGVPAFFIYTLGGATHYHDVEDKPENLSLAGFEGLYKLLLDFTDWLQGK